MTGPFRLVDSPRTRHVQGRRVLSLTHLELNQGYADPGGVPGVGG